MGFSLPSVITFVRPLLPALLLALVGCPGPAPLVRGQVAGIADNVQRRESLQWGDPVQVLEPGQADAQGHQWWQLRYVDGPGGEPRIILIDNNSAWGRLPPKDYPVRIVVEAPAVPPAGAPPIAVEGSLILLVDPWANRTPEADAALEREVARLNALAGSTNLYPLFSVRRDRNGRSALVYGWQGDRGIAKNAAVTSWLEIRTAYKSATWVDLLP